MQAIWIISKTINCLQIPFFILTVAVLSVLLLRPSRAAWILASIGFLLLLWRCFFDITSSRYCASFLVYCLVATAIFATEIKRNRFVSILVFPAFVILATYNTIKPFIAFRDSYIKDAQDIIMDYSSKRPQDIFYIQGKEYDRLRSDRIESNPNIRLAWETDYRFAAELFNKYSLSGIHLYVIERNNLYNSEGRINPPGTHLKLEKLFLTDHAKRRKLAIYHYAPKSIMPLKEPIPETRVLNNIIRNGDIETVQSHEQSIKPLKKWIDQGATFYVSDEVKLPLFRELLETWRTIDSSNYPIVYADSENVIDGTYSLHIVLPLHHKSNILFSNRIRTVPGRLSFLAKPMNRESTFVVSRFDFQPGKYGVTPPLSSFVFRLSDQSVYRIEIPLNEATIGGIESLFYISGSEVDILIDDIEFTPDDDIQNES